MRREAHCADLSAKFLSHSEGLTTELFVAIFFAFHFKYVRKRLRFLKFEKKR